MPTLNELVDEVKANLQGYALRQDRITYVANPAGLTTTSTSITVGSSSNLAKGIICVEQIAGHHPQPLDYKNIPGCTYCSPEIASVGYTEKGAKEAGFDIKVGKFPFYRLFHDKIKNYH